MKYVKFTKELVAVHKGTDGKQECTVIHPETPTDVLEYLHEEGCIDIFWTVYGVTEDGLSEAIYDTTDGVGAYLLLNFLQGLIEVHDMYVSDIRVRIYEIENSLTWGQLGIGREAKEQVDHWNATLKTIKEKLV